MEKSQSRVEVAKAGDSESQMQATHHKSQCRIGSSRPSAEEVHECMVCSASNTRRMIWRTCKSMLAAVWATNKAAAG